MSRFKKRNIRSTALYSSPFSRDYWVDAAAEMKNTKMLVIAALMIALRVATKGLSLPIAPNLDLFNVASFITALSSMIIGPVLAIPAAIVSDFLGVLIWDGLGSYFLPFVLQEIGSSLIWALLLYRQKVNSWRVVLGRFLICFIVNVLLGTGLLILYQRYTAGTSSVALTLPRILKNTFMFPIESVVMTLFLSAMIPITSRMGLTFYKFTPDNKLKLSKKQLIALALLFVLGLGAVGGYLAYYYDTTSLSSSYTQEERTEKNKDMLSIIKTIDESYGKKNYVTIVDSAKQQFLGTEITYKVSIYQMSDDVPGSMMMQCWELSKSGPTKDPYKDYMTKVATATIIVNDYNNVVVDVDIEKVKS